FGGDLCQRGEHALAEFDLARTHLNHTARQDAQPDRETGIGRERWRQRGLGIACPCHQPLSRLARRLEAAASTARTIRLCAPHRHRLWSSAARTSSSLGSSLTASSPAALITTPEMQYPHCAACPSMIACAAGCSPPDTPSPSTVVTSRFSIAHIGVSQELAGRPSMSTRQAPHRPRPQPKRVPVSPRWFRSTYSSAVSR